MNHNRKHPQPRPSNRTLAVIPARLASTRLPRKLLLRETGKSILRHTYESVLAADCLDEVIVAAADHEIAHEARSFGARVVMTDPDLPSGTDRVAAVARLREDAEFLVNVQGDEPEISPRSLNKAVAALIERPNVSMATLATPIRCQRDLEDPSCVKVVFDDRGRALYFSRSPIPFVRDRIGSSDFSGPPRFFQHVGLYVYRRDLLLRLAELPPSPLELAERLEQLRVLGAGELIQVAIIEESAPGIDTAEDYRRFVRRMAVRTT